MNGAIIAAIMSAQRNSVTPPINRFNHNPRNNKSSFVATKFLLQKGDTVNMKIAENETIVSTIIQYIGHECSCRVANQQITAPTFEDCLQKIIETTHAKEIQLIPHSISASGINNTVPVTGYLLLLKVDKQLLSTLADREMSIELPKQTQHSTDTSYQKRYQFEARSK